MNVFFLIFNGTKNSIHYWIVFMKYNKKFDQYFEIDTNSYYEKYNKNYLKIDEIYWKFKLDDIKYLMFKSKNKYSLYKSWRVDNYFEPQYKIYRYNNNNKIEYDHDYNEKLEYFDTFRELIETLNFDFYQLYLKTYKFKEIHDELALVPKIGKKYQELNDNWQNYFD